VPARAPITFRQQQTFPALVIHAESAERAAPRDRHLPDCRVGRGRGGFRLMRQEAARRRWYSDGMGAAAIVALAIHVVIIATLVGNGVGNIWHPGTDTIEGTSAPTRLSGMPMKPVWHMLGIIVVDDWSGKAVDSAVVHDLVADRVMRTSAIGLVTVPVRAGAMLAVRVTRRGFDVATLRVPNVADTVQLHMVRLRRLPLDR
jgi:hypothetical protein